MIDTLDGWLISDAIAHILTLAYAPVKPAPVPTVATESAEDDERGVMGWCDGCGHTWQFCECDD